MVWGGRVLSVSLSEILNGSGVAVLNISLAQIFGLSDVVES